MSRLTLRITPLHHVTFDHNCTSRERSLLYKSKGKDHITSTSQKAGLTRWYKKFLFMSTTDISKLVFQEVDSKVILPLTFIKEWAFPGTSIMTWLTFKKCFRKTIHNYSKRELQKMVSVCICGLKQMLVIAFV